MPRRIELTWDKHSKRWKKFYKGTQYYFRFGKSKDDKQGYVQALEAWRRKKAELDGTRYADSDLSKWQQLIATAYMLQQKCEQKDTPDNRRRWSFIDEMRTNYQALLDRGIPFDDEALTIDKGRQGGKLPIVAESGGWEPPPWEASETATVEAIEDDATVEGCVSRYLKRKQQLVERGEFAAGHYDTIRICLADFAKRIGGGKPIASINGGMLSGYRDSLEKRIDKADKAAKDGKTGEKGFSRSYAKRHLDTAKQFVRWCWQLDLLELPRIVDSRGFNIEVHSKQILVFTLGEIQSLYADAPDIARLYLLLMLNCGMTQQDIAQLQQSEVDWQSGRINRKRSKTRKHRDVPEVSYPLWPETFKLLLKHRSNDPTFALTNRNGSPLKTETIGENGKVKKTDNVKSAFFRIARKAKINKPPKLLRKTAASKLAEHAEYGKFAQYFLGHSPKTIADKHYVQPSAKQFDLAVKWLGEQFPLDTSDRPMATVKSENKKGLGRSKKAVATGQV